MVLWEQFIGLYSDWLIKFYLLIGQEILFGIGVGVEKLTMIMTLGNYQSPWTLERKDLHPLIQVFSTIQQAKASNAIVLKNGQTIGLMLVINGTLKLMYHALQMFLQ